MDNLKNVVDIVAYAVALASVVVKLTATPKDDLVLAKVVNFLKLLSLNKDDK